MKDISYQILDLLEKYGSDPEGISGRRQGVSLGTRNLLLVSLPSLLLLPQQLFSFV